MHAVRIHEFGGPEVLRYEQAPVPVPGAGEVLVRTAAVGVNPPDWYMREGMPGLPADALPPMPLPITLGTDVAGTVTALGAGVDRFAPGDEVFGLLRFPDALQAGAYAEYVVAPAGDLARRPSSVDRVSAAGAPMAALTAWQYLVDLGHDAPSPFQERAHEPVPLGPGVTVLINGAAGGVGHLALQLAKWKGAEVVAVASGAHRRLLDDLGADRVVDYTADAPEDVVRDVDLVLDTVGGAGSGRLLATLRPGGSLFTLFPFGGDDDGARPDVRTSATQVRANGTQLQRIAELLADGTVRVAIDSTYALADARAAHERAARGHLGGKLVLTVP